MPLIIDIKAIPSSGRQKFVLDKSRNIKCYLKNQPEKGKANTELIKFLSKKLGIPQNKITIFSGKTSQKKRIKIDNKLTLDQLCIQLDIKENR